jgi:hypothetical protein
MEIILRSFRPDNGDDYDGDDYDGDDNDGDDNDHDKNLSLF